MDHQRPVGPDRHRQPRLAAFRRRAIRILIFGNALHAPSGYGTQALQLARTLRAHGHEVACAAFWGLHGAPLSFDGFPVFPGSSEDPFARDLLPIWYRYWQADLCITLMDVFVLDPAQLGGMNIAHWMPVDTQRLSEMDKAVISRSPGRVIAMSRHGEKVLAEAGFSPLYAPHALDMQVWSPLEDRDGARKQLGWDGQFVIGINAANQDPVRKAYPEQLEAFAAFAGHHDDARMVIHARAVTQQGPDLNALIAYYGLQGRAVLGQQEPVAGGLVTEAMMVSWHGVMDVLSNCAYGEGFGLAVLQSQATGTPVVVNDCSAMRELCGAGWLTAGQSFWNKGHRANWQVPFISSVLAAYEDAYGQARDPAVRDKARQFALAWDAEKVWEEHWAPVLEELRPGRRARPAPAARKIWAPVMFRGETDMLEMRLEECGALADMHVIVESPVTHRGVPKDLAFGAAGDRLARFIPQMLHVITDLPQDASPWEREHAQRDAAWPLIDAGAADSDWVLIGDTDEIPSRSLLERLRSGDVPGEAVAVRMRVFLWHARFEVPQDRVPPQCVAATAGFIRRHGGSLAAVRDSRGSYPVVEDGGWHFSWFGGPDAMREKLETATCHTELLGTREAEAIADGTRYRSAEDFGGLPVIRVDIDGSFPARIRAGDCPVAWLGPEAAA